MKKTLLSVALITGAMAFSAAAFAEADMKPSHSNKKSGKVAFEKVEDTAPVAASEAAPLDPSAIEPAAGAAEMDAPAAKDSKLADDLKLPRKN